MITAEKLKEVNKTLSTIDVKGKNYAPVTERIKAFRQVLPNGTIDTEIIQLDGDKVIMKTTIKDGECVLATGLAYEICGSSYINKTSYIENCETSAVGRALGMLGIGIDASMASAEEVTNAIKQQEFYPSKKEMIAAINNKWDEKQISKILEANNCKTLSECTESQIMSLYNRVVPAK